MNRLTMLWVTESFVSGHVVDGTEVVEFTAAAVCHSGVFDFRRHCRGFPESHNAAPSPLIQRIAESNVSVVTVVLAHGKAAAILFSHLID